MKKILLSSLLTLSSLVYAQTPELPKIFTSETPVLQDRMCGELLVGMAIAGARSGSSNKSEVIHEIAYHSVLFLNITSNLEKESKEKAKLSSRKIEALPVDTHIETLKYCKNRVNLLISNGKFTDEEQKKAKSVSNEILNKVSKK
jgi:hypothetical protein